MAFEAGAITGKIDLDTTSFKDGVSEAHTHAESEGGRIREVFESISESLTEALGPALGQIGGQLQSVFAGFSEGPMLGAINAIGVGLGAVREVTTETGERFDEMGLAAKKAGVGVEWLSTLSGVGETVGLSVDQLTMSFRMLEEAAAEASQGKSPEAARAFQAIGISAQEAARLMSDPEKLFTRVQHAIEGQSNASLRLQAAHDLLGRSGQDLIPLLTMEENKYNEIAKNVKDFGVVVTDSNAETGESFSQLTTYLDFVGKGIEKAFATPILEEFQKHQDEIVKKMHEFQTAVITDVPAAWHAVQKDWDFVGGPQAVSKLGPAYDKFKNVAGLTDADMDKWGIQKANLGYDPTSVKGAPIPAMPAGLMPHLRTDTAVGMAENIQHQLSIAQSPLQQALSGLSLQGVAGPGIHAPPVAAVEGQLHAAMVSLQPALDHYLRGRTAGLSGPELDKVGKELNSFASSVLAADAALKHLATPSTGSLIGALPGSAAAGLTGIFDLATGNIGAAAQAAGSFVESLRSLGPALAEATADIHELIEYVTSARSGAPHSTVYGPPTPMPSDQPSTTQPAGSVTIHNVHTSFNPADTANMVANRLLPVFRSNYDRQQQQLAGAAQQAIIEKTICGG